MADINLFDVVNAMKEGQSRILEELEKQTSLLNRILEVETASQAILTEIAKRLTPEIVGIQIEPGTPTTHGDQPPNPK